MEWENWQVFWSMGGYGRYVWGSFAVTAALMAVELMLAQHRHRAARAAILRSKNR